MSGVSASQASSTLHLTTETFHRHQRYLDLLLDESEVSPFLSPQDQQTINIALTTLHQLSQRVLTSEETTDLEKERVSIEEIRIGKRIDTLFQSRAPIFHSLPSYLPLPALWATVHTYLSDQERILVTRALELPALPVDQMELQSMKADSLRLQKCPNSPAELHQWLPSSIFQRHLHVPELEGEGEEGKFPECDSSAVRMTTSCQDLLAQDLLCHWQKVPGFNRQELQTWVQNAEGQFEHLPSLLRSSLTHYDALQKWLASTGEFDQREEFLKQVLLCIEQGNFETGLTMVRQVFGNDIEMLAISLTDLTFDLAKKDLKSKARQTLLTATGLFPQWTERVKNNLLDTFDHLINYGCEQIVHALIPDLPKELRLPVKRKVHDRFFILGKLDKAQAFLQHIQQSEGKGWTGDCVEKTNLFKEVLGIFKLNLFYLTEGCIQQCENEEIITIGQNWLFQYYLFFPMAWGHKSAMDKYRDKEPMRLTDEFRGFFNFYAKYFHGDAQQRVDEIFNSLSFPYSAEQIIEEATKPNPQKPCPYLHAQSLHLVEALKRLIVQDQIEEAGKVWKAIPLFAIQYGVIDWLRNAHIKKIQTLFQSDLAHEACEFVVHFWEDDLTQCGYILEKAFLTLHQSNEKAPLLKIYQTICIFPSLTPEIRRMCALSILSSLLIEYDAHESACQYVSLLPAPLQEKGYEYLQRAYLFNGMIEQAESVHLSIPDEAQRLALQCKTELLAPHYYTIMQCFERGDVTEAKKAIQASKQSQLFKLWEFQYRFLFGRVGEGGYLPYCELGDRMSAPFSTRIASYHYYMKRLGGKERLDAIFLNREALGVEGVIHEAMRRDLSEWCGIREEHSLHLSQIVKRYIAINAFAEAKLVAASIPLSLFRLAALHHIDREERHKLFP